MWTCSLKHVWEYFIGVLIVRSVPMTIRNALIIYSWHCGHTVLRLLRWDSRSKFSCWHGQKFLCYVSSYLCCRPILQTRGPRRVKWINYGEETLCTALYMVFQKELYNDIPNVTVWRVLRKVLHLKAYKLSIFQGVERFYITPWPQSASELYRPGDRRLPAKLVPTLCGYRVPRGQRDESIRPYSRLSRVEPLLLLPSSSSVVLTRLSGPCSRPTTFFV
jgi:hypothetical protein